MGVKIDLLEVLRQKDRLSDVNTEMVSTLAKVDTEMNNCCTNLTGGGTALEVSVASLNNTISIVAEKLKKAVPVLVDFMGAQMQSYQVSLDDANAQLQDLIDVLKTNYAEDGTITNSGRLITSDMRADATINDSSSYSSGKNNYTTLENKIRSETEWNNLNECFYYFKEKGLSDEQIAGILGNACQESGFVLDIKNPTSTSKGLFQWLDSRYPSDWSLETQLDHAWNEMQGTPCGGNISSVVDSLSSKTTVADATNTFAVFFEGASKRNNETGAMYVPDLSVRTNFANTIYAYIKDNLS